MDYSKLSDQDISMKNIDCLSVVGLHFACTSKIWCRDWSPADETAT